MSKVDINPTFGTSGPISLPLAESQTSRTQRKRRFLRFGLAIFGLLFVFHFLHLGRFFGFHRFCPHRYHDGITGDNLVIQTTSDDTKRVCPEWPKPDGEPPFESKLSFALPSEAGVLYLASEGSAVGQVAMNTDPSVPPEQVQIDVTVKYWHPHQLDGKKHRHATACQVSSNEGQEVGVVVWSHHHHHHHHPHHPPSHHLPYFDIKVSFSEGGNIDIKNFTTAMGIFPHSLSDLKGKIYFDSIHLNAVNAPIGAESLEGGTITAKTVNSPVKGKFYSGGVVSLETVNSPIEGDILLKNSGGKASSASLKTVHSPIRSSIELVQPQSGVGGNFSLIFQSEAGPVDAVIPTAPLNTTLHVMARSSLSPVSVTLPATYEGRYRLETLMSPAGLEVRDDVSDPERRGRKKIYEKGRDGFVEWSDEEGNPTGIGRERGFVFLKTILSPVKLVW